MKLSANRPQELTSREEHQGAASPSRRGSQLRGKDVGRMTVDPQHASRMTVPWSAAVVAFACLLVAWPIVSLFVGLAHEEWALQAIASSLLALIVVGASWRWLAAAVRPAGIVVSVISVLVCLAALEVQKALVV